MNTYQRVLREAERIKAAKRAGAERLPAGALRHIDESRITIKLHGRTLHLLRITEVQAEENARRGWYRGMHVHEYRRFSKDWKRCAGPCGLFRPRRMFSPDARNEDGLHSWCKKCRAAAEREAYRRGRRRRKKSGK